MANTEPAAMPLVTQIIKEQYPSMSSTLPSKYDAMDNLSNQRLKPNLTACLTSQSNGTLSKALTKSNTVLAYGSFML